MAAVSLKIYLIILFNTIISAHLVMNLCTLLFDDAPNDPVNFSDFPNSWKLIFQKGMHLKSETS